MCAVIKQEVESGGGGQITGVTSRPTTLEFRPVTWAPPTLRPIGLPTIRPITLQARPLGLNMIQPQFKVFGSYVPSAGVPAVYAATLPSNAGLQMPRYGVGLF